MLNLSYKDISKEVHQQKLFSVSVATARKSRRRLIYWLTGLILGAIFILFLPWRQNIRANGELTAFTPGQRPQTVQATIPGSIQQWYVQEGDYVNRGDTIVRLTEIKDKYFDPQIIERMGDQIESKEQVVSSNLDKLQAYQNQLSALRQSRELKLEQVQNKIEQYRLKVTSDSNDWVAAQIAAEVAENQAERSRSLFDQGLASRTKLEDRISKEQQADAKLISARNKYLSTKNELLNAKIDLNGTIAEYADKISKVQSELNATQAYIADTEATISKMNVDQTNTRIRASYYIIRAPQNGYVVNAIRTGVGENVKEGEAITTIMPENPELAAELYIRAMDLPLLDKGRHVRLQFDGWPAIVFGGWPGASVGTFGGIVKVIDYVNSGNGKYRILVTPDPNDNPWPSQLRVGSGVYGWAILDTVPIWFEIWRQINGFPPNLIDDEKAGKGGGDKKGADGKGTKTAAKGAKKI